MVADKFGAAIDQVCLIFAGKILKDQETLKFYNLKDGLTVHLVIKSSNRATQDAPNYTPAQAPAPAAPAPATASPVSEPGLSPFGIGGLGGLSGISLDILC